MNGLTKVKIQTVTILILVDGFLQFQLILHRILDTLVTILILVDGFLQYRVSKTYKDFPELSQSLF